MEIRKYLKNKMLWLYARIIREKASPEYIARGWAIGMFYGCLIPFGFQLVCSVPTAFLLKGSKVGAMLGTLLTNHVTIFFIYPAQCYVGSLLLGGHLNYAQITEAMKGVLEQQSYQALFAIGAELVASFFIGGALLTAVCTPVTYFFVKRLVISYREKKARKAAAKANR